MAAGDLTDLATAKIAASISNASPETDQILAAYISAISAYVPQVIGRGILSATYAETYEGNGKQAILLRQRPVLAISSVAFEGGLTLSDAGDPIAGSSGIWTDGLSACIVGDVFPRGAICRIIYSAGYATSPLDVSLAVAELVAEAYQRRAHVGEASRSQGGQITVSFDQRKMHAAIADKLNSYKIGAPC